MPDEFDQYLTSSTAVADEFDQYKKKVEPSLLDSFSKFLTPKKDEFDQYKTQEVPSVTTTPTTAPQQQASTPTTTGLGQTGLGSIFTGFEQGIGLPLVEKITGYKEPPYMKRFKEEEQKRYPIESATGQVIGGVTQFAGLGKIPAIPALAKYPLAALGEHTVRTLALSSAIDNLGSDHPNLNQYADKLAKVDIPIAAGIVSAAGLAGAFTKNPTIANYVIRSLLAIEKTGVKITPETAKTVYKVASETLSRGTAGAVGAGTSYVASKSAGANEDTARVNAITAGALGLMQGKPTPLKVTTEPYIRPSGFLPKEPQAPAEETTITNAAIPVEGKVYEAPSHGEALEKAKAEGKDISTVDRGADGLFRTNDGRLISRDQAQKEAGISSSEQIPTQVGLPPAEHVPTPEPLKTVGEEAGAIQIGALPGVQQAGEAILNAQDYLSKSKEMTELSGNIADDLLKLRLKAKADKIRANKLIKSANVSAKDEEAILYHIEDKNYPLTLEQQQLLETQIEPIRADRERLFNKIKKDGKVPLTREDYTPRQIAGKGGIYDRIIAEIESTGGGVGVLSKSGSMFKKRTMKALVDEKGNRVIASIKDGKVVVFTNKQPEFAGNLNMKQYEDLLDKEIKPLNERIKALSKEKQILSSVKTRDAVGEQRVGNLANKITNLKDTLKNRGITKEARAEMNAEIASARKELRAIERARVKPTEEIVLTANRIKTIDRKIAELETKIDMATEKYNPNELNNKVFIDKNGHTWKVTDARVKEIEANTNLKYHKFVMENELLAHNKLRQIDRAIEYLDKLKESPEFRKVAYKLGEGLPPEGWRTTDLPQFRGWVFDQRTAEVFDDFNRKMQQGGDPLRILSAVNGVLRNAIFFNPLIHIPNIVIHAIVRRGLYRLAIPKDYLRLYQSGSRALEAILTRNNDYIEMLENGANLLFSDTVDDNFQKIMLDKTKEELKQDNKLAEFVAKDLKYLNPAELIKGIYRFSGQATWFINDLATMQAVYEEMAEGKTMQQAIKEVGKHIPNYVLPSRVLNSRLLAEANLNKNLTMFGAYHYGAFRSYGEMLKDLAGKGKTPQERLEALDKLAMLAVVIFLMYPALDKVAEKVTGKKGAFFRRAGAATIPVNTWKMLTGKIDYSQWLQSIYTPAPATKELVQLFFNINTYTKKPLIAVENILEDLKKQIVDSISPVKTIEGAITQPLKVGASLVGITIPSGTEAEQTARKLRSKNMPSTFTPEQQKRFKTESEIRDLLKTDPIAGMQELKKQREDKTLTRKEANQVRHSALRGETKLQRLSKSLSYDDFMKVYELSSPEEKQELEKIKRVRDRHHR